MGGAFFIAVAAAVVFASWLSATHSHGRSWVVAARALRLGQPLSAGDLTTVAAQLPAGIARQAFGAPSDLVGRTLAAPVAAGQLIQAADLVPAGSQPGLRPVGVAIDPAELNDLRVGQLADVLSSTGTGPTTATVAVVRGARVLAVQGASSGLVGAGSGSSVTLGVSSLAEVEAVVSAIHAGTVTVVAAQPSDGTGLGDPAGASAGS